MKKANIFDISNKKGWKKKLLKVSYKFHKLKTEMQYMIKPGIDHNY